MRVPLIWRPAPSADIPPAVIESPVGHLDIAPTVCAIAGIDPHALMQGASLPVTNDNKRERVITEWDSDFDGLEIKLRTLYRDGYIAAMSLSLLKFVGQASLVDEAMLPS